MCKHCGRVFAGAAGLCSHMRSSACAEDLPLPVAGKRRHRYTFRQKRKYLLQLDELRIAKTHFAPTVLALSSGVGLASILEWDKNREAVFRLAATPHVGGRCSYYPSQPDYAEQEYLLYVRFVWRRQYQKLRVGTSWLAETCGNY